MAARPSSSAKFGPFSRLPAELREMIWRHALPVVDPPALTPYRAGCWCPIPPDNEDANNQAPVTMVFHHELLDRIRVRTPFASVSSEARKIGFQWAQDQGFEIHYDANNDPICLRPFDPTRDTIWIGLNEVDIFNAETWSATDTNHPSENLVVPTDITRFAIPELMLDESVPFTLLRDTVCCFFRDTTLYVVTGRLPIFKQRECRDTEAIQPRWELENIPGAHSFIWDSQGGRSEIQNGDHVLVGPFSFQVTSTISAIADVLDANADERVMSFELRPMRVVKK
jgi:hypothetical protein